MARLLTVLVLTAWGCVNGALAQPAASATAAAATLEESGLLIDLTGRLSDRDSVLPDRNTYYDRHTIRVRAGMRYTISLSSESFDSYLILHDADGQELAWNDDGPFGLDSEVVWDAERDAELTILATSLEPQALGLYRLTVVESTRVPPGRKTALSVAGQLSPRSAIDEERRYYLDHPLEVSLGHEYEISLSAEFDTYLILLDTSGRQVLALNDDGPDGTNSLINWIADRTGRIIIRATSFGPQVTGGYRLEVTETPCVEELFIQVEQQFLASEVRLGDFFFEAGRSYSIATVDLSPGCETRLQVRRTSMAGRTLPNDPVVAEDEDSGDEPGASLAHFNCRASGVFYVLVTPRSDTQGGAFSLRITER